MPIYGYRCSQCGHELEVLQSMSAEPLRVCPECAGELRKLLYPVGVLFKGSGFYSTDYRSDRGGSGSKAETNGSKDSADSSGSGPADAGAGGGSSSTEKKAESAAGKE